jgi:hypothetical protein
VNSDPTLIQRIMLSDHVIREVGTGKLSLIGCFQFFNAPSFPLGVNRFFVTVFLSNFRGKLDQLKVTARIEDRTSGHVVASCSADVSSDEAMEDSEIMDLSFPFGPLIFPSAGITLL